MLLLTSTTDKLQLVTDAAVTVDVHASYMDYNGSVVTPGRQNTAITTATTTDIVGSPASGVQRNIKALNIRNKHVSSSVDATLVFDQNGTDYELYKATLQAGEALQYVEGIGFAVSKGVGVIVNRAYAEYTSWAALSTLIPYDDTIPQNSEGTEIINVSITPLSVTNRIRATFAGWGTTNGNAFATVALFRDSVADALAVTSTWCETAAATRQFALIFEHVPATVSSVAYKIRAGANTGSTYFNGSHTSRLFGGVSKSTLVLEEIAA